MKSVFREADWVIGGWICHVIFFVAISFSLSGGAHRDSMWYYVGISMLLLLIASLNVVLDHIKDVRYFIALTVMMTNTFLIPFSLYSFNSNLSFGYIAAAGLIYVIACVAFSPRYIGLGVLVAAIGFASYLNYKQNVFDKYPEVDIALAGLEKKITGPQEFDNLEKDKFRFYTVKKVGTLKEISGLKEVYGNRQFWKYLWKANKAWLPDADTSQNIEIGRRLIVPILPKSDKKDFLMISIAYIAGAMLGYCWRLLAQKIYSLYIMALTGASIHEKKKENELEKELDKVSNDYRLLKEETAMHIIEMKQIAQAAEKEPEGEDSEENKPEENE